MAQYRLSELKVHQHFPNMQIKSTNGAISGNFRTFFREPDVRYSVKAIAESGLPHTGALCHYPLSGSLPTDINWKILKKHLPTESLRSGRTGK